MVNFVLSCYINSLFSEREKGGRDVMIVRNDVTLIRCLCLKLDLTLKTRLVYALVS